MKAAIDEATDAATTALSTKLTMISLGGGAAAVTGFLSEINWAVVLGAVAAVVSVCIHIGTFALNAWRTRQEVARADEAARMEVAEHALRLKLLQKQLDESKPVPL